MRVEVTRDDKEIVSAVRAALAGRVGSDRLAVWFGRSVRLAVAGATLHVLVGEAFRLEYLRRSFRTDLAASAQAVLGDAACVEFALDEQLVAAEEAPATLPLLAAAAESPPEEKLPRLAKRQFARLTEFVTSPASQVAYAAAQTTAAQPGTYSPLTLVGPPGCGKTHLLEGIWRQIRTGGSLKRVIYLSAEQFTNQFLEALKHSGTPSFRRKYRDVEVLLIDDVNFLAGKQSTIVELVHTIDTLLRDGRQLVFTADRTPAELRGLGPELVARLSGGLVCTLQSADAPARLGILRQLVGKQSTPIPDDVLTWLAAQLDGDARQLAGAVNRLVATSEAVGRSVDFDFAQEALADLVHAARRPVRVPQIMDAVCEVFGVEAGELQSSSKSPAVALPRMLVMFLARKYTRAALSEIGRVLGRRSHSTVVSAQHKVGAWITSGKRVPLGPGECSLADAVQRVEAQLRIG